MDTTYKHLFGFIFTALFTIGPVFQLTKLIKTKNGKALSIPSYWINSVGQVAVLSYYHDDLGNVWTIINSILAIIINTLTVYYIKLYERNKVL